ncbi:dihydrofolate reductase [Microbulbifer guangxiensis]|uniref:dihydrofolate reductase n=1 Tax=Microbulbifer guangxiensis TaxID=2904249 RepID=UPI001F16AB25|nr:dihydrofolate reductase [Microbulbifer guangxiensis]
MKEVPIAMIAAMAQNRTIGRDNTLPWRISGDLKFFKRVTMSKPVIMGRKTFESIGRPLPGRTNIVITRNPEWRAEGVTAVSSLEEALVVARQSAADSGAEEVMVIGGAEIYRQALPMARRLYITEVEAQVEGDAFFPEFANGWSETGRDCYPASDRDEYNYCLVQYDRSK